MKFIFHIQKRHFFSILVAIFILAGAITAYAYGTNNPSNFGHSAGEIDGITLDGSSKNLQGAIDTLNTKISTLDTKISTSPSGGGFSNFQVFDTNNPSWTIPTGTTKIMVEVWGAGGKGICKNGPGGVQGFAAGGGGGGYGRGTYSVTAGNVYNIIVGEGGINFEGKYDGKSSSFTGPGISISSTGGKQGSQDVNGNQNGGEGGTSNAPFSIAGANGDGLGGIRGGDAGNGGSGGMYPRSTLSNKNNGVSPGGGGACGNGANGLVVVWY